MSDLTENSNKSKLTTLKAKKYAPIDFFIADEFEILSFRDEMASMEHPFFALRGGDKKIRNYKNGDNYLIVKPSYDGLATIFDKDIWIYAISKLQQAINEKKLSDINLIGRTLFFKPYDFFVVANRDKGGRSYKELLKALGRLSGTRVQTNIKNGGRREIEEFGLIDRWKVVEENNNGIEAGMIEIVLPDWLFNALENNQILKINPDYFRIRKAIDRRIYELARKHCGNQYECELGIEKLHIKTGSTSLLKMFRFNIKQLAKDNNLPDYEVILDNERDMVIFRNRAYCKSNIKNTKKPVNKAKNTDYIYESIEKTLSQFKEQKINLTKYEIDMLNTFKVMFEGRGEIEFKTGKQEKSLFGIFTKYHTLQPIKNNKRKDTTKIEQPIEDYELSPNMVLQGKNSGVNYIIDENLCIIGFNYKKSHKKDYLAIGCNTPERLKELINEKHLIIKD